MVNSESIHFASSSIRPIGSATSLVSRSTVAPGKRFRRAGKIVHDIVKSPMPSMRMSRIRGAAGTVLSDRFGQNNRGISRIGQRTT
jgi:hypothetical protein